MRRELTFSGPDGDFHYIDWGGDGPILHISHATGFCAGVYSPLAERLRDRFRVVGMDDRGHGRTTAPADPSRLRNWDPFVNDLQRFFEHLGGPVIALGHSRGGVASMLLAIRRPDLIRALVLIDPTILPLSWMWWWSSAKFLGLSKYVPIAHRAARRKAAWPDRDTILKAYRGKGAFRTWDDGFLENYVNCAFTDGDHGQVRLCCDPAWESRCFAVCPHDVWLRIPRLTVPVLLLYGDRSDVCLPAAVKRFRAKVPHARVVGFEQTSHFVPMERLDETVNAVMTFLDEVDGPRPNSKIFS